MAVSHHGSLRFQHLIVVSAAENQRAGEHAEPASFAALSDPDKLGRRFVPHCLLNETEHHERTFKIDPNAFDTV